MLSDSMYVKCPEKANLGSSFDALRVMVVTLTCLEPHGWAGRYVQLSLGSAVLRRECRGLFVPGLTAQNWGSPCKRLPSQTPPRTRPQPPSLRSPEHSRRSLCKLLQRP